VVRAPEGFVDLPLARRTRCLGYRTPDGPDDDTPLDPAAAGVDPSLAEPTVEVTAAAVADLGCRALDGRAPWAAESIAWLAGAVLWSTGAATSCAEGIARARAAIASGDASSRLLADV
jgi:anthranilate phosphoribosyltransferase